MDDIDNKLEEIFNGVRDLVAENKRLRGSHDTMTVDCQIQGCREKSCHELLDKQEAEVKRLRGERQSIVDECRKEGEKLDATIATLQSKLREKDRSIAIVEEYRLKGLTTIGTLLELLQFSADYIKAPFTDRINSAKLLERIEEALPREAPQ